MKYNLAGMDALDIYLSSLSDEEYKAVKNDLDMSCNDHLPIQSWEMLMNGHQNQTIESIKRKELAEVRSFARRYRWHNNLVQTFTEHDYEALILTDKKQNIIWVNDGFTAMTGYSKKFALSKTPNFLQGEKTSEETRQRIREKIKLEKPFTEIIINHRKDNSTYQCEVNIIPLYNKETTHYLALERKVG